MNIAAGAHVLDACTEALDVSVDGHSGAPPVNAKTGEHKSDLIRGVFDGPNRGAGFYGQWGLPAPYDGDLGSICEFVCGHDGLFKVSYSPA